MNPAIGIKSVDSLSAHEFQVALDGQVVSGIFAVQGLTSFVLEGELPPLTITKMVQHDPALPFNAWARASRDGSRPARDVAIIALDEGVETRRWIYRNAIILAIQYSDFDSGRSDLVEERITIRADRVDEVWP